MPNINTMMGGKYLKKEDVPQPMLVTVNYLDQQQVSDGDGGKETKWCMHFNELDKPLVMNTTNLQLAAQAMGSEETESWTGRQLVLYTDPNVSMGGKLVGGLRLRARRVAAPAQPTAAPSAPPPAAPTPVPPAAHQAAAPARAKTPFDDMMDDVPF